MTWLAETLLASSALMVLVLVARRPVTALLGARIAYLLWLLPALRMMLPVLPGAGARSWFVGGETFVSLAPTGGVHMPLITPAASFWATPWPGGTLILLWLAGVACYLLIQLHRYRQFIRSAFCEATLKEHDGSVAVYLSDAVEGPVAAGIFRRHVFLPRDFAERYSAQERRLVLAHELVHHRRGDLIANLAALVFVSVHWFNPLAHYAYRVFRSDQEFACDETVLAEESDTQRSVYGAAVVKTARGRFSIAACALGPAGRLKARLRMMARKHVSRQRRAMGSAAMVAFVFAGLVITASHGTQPPTVPDVNTALPAVTPSPLPDALPVPEPRPETREEPDPMPEPIQVEEPRPVVVPPS